MKVIFDISSVGDNPQTRTGVARTAWTLADLLHQQLGDDLSFSATGSIDASLQTERLLNAHPELHSAIDPVSPVARKIDRLNKRISLNSSSDFIHKVQQSTLLNISRLLNITRQPIDKQKLAQADIFHPDCLRSNTTYFRRKILPARFTRYQSKTDRYYSAR
jgi:hypothetical protein